MRLLRPPIRDRADVCAYTFPGDGSVDVDDLARQLAESAREHEYTLFFRPGLVHTPPVTRVVPLAEQDAYREATAIFVERCAASGVPGLTARVVGLDAVVVDGPQGPSRQVFRLVQTLLS
jgi:hypothetical protein